MPVPVGDGRFVQFRYAPDYLRDAPELVTPASVGRSCVGDCHQSAVIVDGGNVVRFGRTAIVTDKVFRENAALSRGQVRETLQRELEVEILVVIAVEPADPLGHADGVVSLYGERVAWVNEYERTDPRYGRPLYEALRRGGVVAHRLPYAPDLDSTSEIPPATGIYVNMLNLGSLLLVPAYGIATDGDAVDSISMVAGDRAVVAIDCAAVALEGGGLRCITWTRS